MRWDRAGRTAGLGRVFMHQPEIRGETATVMRNHREPRTSPVSPAPQAISQPRIIVTPPVGAAMGKSRAPRRVKSAISVENRVAPTAMISAEASQRRAVGPSSRVRPDNTRTATAWTSKSARHSPAARPRPYGWKPPPRPRRRRPSARRKRQDRRMIFAFSRLNCGTSFFAPGCLFRARKSSCAN